MRDLSLEEWQRLHPAFDGAIHAAIAPRQVVAARRSEGGTGFEQVRLQLQLARRRWQEASASTPEHSGGPV